MFGVTVTAVLSAVVMILVVLFMRFVAGKHISKMAFMLIWAIITARLLIPIDFMSQISIWNFINRPQVPQEFGLTSGFMTHQINWVAVFFALWLIGALAFALYFFDNHRRFRKSVSDAIPVNNQFIIEWQQKNSTFRRIKIKKSDRIDSPLTFGVFKPVIILPDIIELYDEEELSNILAHEYIHIRRFDYVSKIALAVTLCIHWFNPLVWIMYVLANRDIELSCDEIVVKTFDKKSTAYYAMTLINAADTQNQLTVLHSGFAKHSLEERVETILSATKKSKLGAAIAVTVTVVTLLAFAEPLANFINHHVQFTPGSGVITINNEDFYLDDHRNEGGAPVIDMPGVITE